MSVASGEDPRAANTERLPDRWIALSSLQKSIRRGAVEPAIIAAQNLWVEPSRLLDRLLVIGLEDIGVGDVDVLREVIELTTHRTWQRNLPDKGKVVILDLVDRMCAATKSRYTDEILAIAHREPALDQARVELANAPSGLLATSIVTSKDIGVRALASWFLAGTARYPLDGVPRRQGDLAAVWEAARALTVPAGLLELLDRAGRRMPWPLAVMLPLAYVSKANGASTVVVQDAPYETYRGVPLYALDQFTRRGLVAIGRWFAGCPELQDILQVAAPKASWTKIVRYTVFAVESQVCDRRLRWPEQRDVLHRSMLAELTGRGLNAEYMDRLLTCAVANLPALNEHRRAVLEETSA